MKRGQAARLLDDVDYLSLVERVLFLDLLERSDNADCSVPQWRSPRVAELARRSGVSTRTIQRALIHLDRHGWVAYAPGRGRGVTGRFQVAPRRPDHACTCGKSGHPDVQLLADKSGHPTPQKGDRKSGQTPAQTMSTAKGLEGEGSTGRSVERHATVTPIRRTSEPSSSELDSLAGRLWAAGFDN